MEDKIFEKWPDSQEIFYIGYTDHVDHESVLKTAQKTMADPIWRLPHKLDIKDLANWPF